MSLFDEIKNAVVQQTSGSAEGEKHSNLVNAALQMFGNKQGLSDLARK